ncbi:MAG TPA: right-handed parallel beta-helix repeat-containing protein [Thermoguttaceae bacterium]|nr:right-handed parallel beta-helix repeat-containing protein [Thermoguttaceae bacterium]
MDAYGSMSSAFSLRKVQYVRLQGFYCVAPYRGRGSAIGAGNSQYIEIINCVATGGGQGGVDANHCDHVMIDGVEAFFNGGGTAWSSGISLLEPKSKDNVVRNCVCYGNYDNSSYRSDGNGIIIDNAYNEGGALLVNNLCYMNGGKGICSTRSDNCTFLNNTCVANCWQPNQQDKAHELSVRGANNVVRNNIAVSMLPDGVGMQALLNYSGPTGKVEIDPNGIRCDHNLFFNPQSDACVAVSGNRRMVLGLAELKETMPNWGGDSWHGDPGFVDLGNLDFRLRSDSPALKGGIASAEVPSDLLGRPRPASGACSFGCFEGSHSGPAGPYPQPGVEIADGQDGQAIALLLNNEYEFEWHGMLWGFGKLLPEELPLQIEIQGPRRADFLNLSGRYVLRDLLDQLARKHRVRLVLRQPDECRGLSTTPHTITSWLSVRDGADVDERAFVHRRLQTYLWTDDADGKTPLVTLLPAMSAATGIRIDTETPLPADWSCPMITRNMKLSTALDDLARRMSVRFILSRQDPLAEDGAGQTVELGRPFGQENGLVELTVERPDGRGRIDLFARVRSDSCMCARIFDDNSRFISPAGIDDTGAGEMYHKAATRLDASSRVRLAVIGSGCALMVGDEWVMLNRLPRGMDKGPFQVRVVDDWIKVGRIRYASL